MNDRPKTQFVSYQEPADVPLVTDHAPFKVDVVGQHEDIPAQSIREAAEIASQDPAASQVWRRGEYTPTTHWAPRPPYCVLVPSYELVKVREYRHLVDDFYGMAQRSSDPAPYANSQGWS